MPLDESLIYAQLLDISESMGVLKERTECLPELETSVAKLEQRVHDHLKESHVDAKPRSRTAQGGILAGVVAAIAAVAYGMGELARLLGR